MCVCAISGAMESDGVIVINAISLLNKRLKSTEISAL